MRNHQTTIRSILVALGVAAVLVGAADSAAGQSLLLKGGLVYTITGPVLKDADIAIEKGKITKIGHGLAAPKGAKTMDMRGKVLMPGLVLSRRVWSFGSPPDGVDVFDLSLQLALASGITSASTGGYVMKMTYGDPSGVTLASVPEVRISISSWMGLHNLRRNLLQAREYLREVSIYEQAVREGKPARKPAMQGGISTYVRLIKGEIPARVSLDRAQDILRAVSLAREFNIRLIIEGAVESWAVAEEIGRANASVVLSVRDLTEPERNPDAPPGSNVRVAAILRRAGVSFALVPPVGGVAITGGIPGRGITSLAMEAAFAVRGGLDEPTALAAITIEPAKILGVSHRIGSLEEGKDADIIVLDGDPLYWKSFVELTIINGTVYYDRSKTKILPRN